MKQIDVLPEYENYIKDYGILLSECKCFCFEAGELVLEQGEKGEFLYFIVEGIARVQVCSIEGKILSLSYSETEGVLGEVELVGGSETSSASIIAEIQLICLVYPYAKAKLKCENDIHFINKLARDLAAKLSRSTSSFLSASFASAESRVCVYLLKETEQGVYRGTLAKASEATGISYRHLQRVMIHLCNDGILRKEKDGYHVLNFKELHKRTYT